MKFFGGGRRKESGETQTGPLVDSARRIIEQHTPKAFEIAYRMTGDRSAAWDLVQSAMVKVLGKFDTYDANYKVEQWLYGILRHLYVDSLRLAGRRREVALDEPVGESGLSLHDKLVDPSPRPDEILDREVGRDEVQAALNELPPDLRMAVVLVDMEGMSYEDAARALDCPPSTLGVRVFRARKRLKERLGPSMEAP